MASQFLAGQRVKFRFYGAYTLGTVEQDQRSSIVFVRKDGSRRGIWMHAENLTHVNNKENQT